MIAMMGVNSIFTITKIRTATNGNINQRDITNYPSVYT